MKNKITVGLIGGSGFIGEVLLDLITPHPEMELKAVSSRNLSGKNIHSALPDSPKDLNLNFSHPDDPIFLDCDVIFFATPHGTSMDYAKKFLNSGKRIIDLSADFRFKDPNIWYKWYSIPHRSESLLPESVYGLTELYREEIKASRLISIPGCYPTASLLGLLPALSKIPKIKSVIIDAKSGITGAGRKAVETYLTEEIKDNFRAYSTEGHRHYPEIKLTSEKVHGSSFNLSFLPQLMPVMRGIYATIYVNFETNVDIDMHSTYKDYYSSSRDIKIVKEAPNLNATVGTNKCMLYVNHTQIENQIVVISCIDNLIKGAAGQAIECFNLMNGFDQNLGLD